MTDREKSGEQLIQENADLRRRVAALEAQLARSQQAEADQRQINNSLPVLVATAGLDGYYKEVNAAFERILGWSEQESLSRPFLDFIHPEDRAMAVETFARLKAGTPAVNFLDRNICRDGSHRWISWTAIPVPSRGIVFGIGQDITERRQALQALRESEERFQAFMDNSPSAAWMKDEQGRYVYLSKSYEKLLGVRLEDWRGKTDFDLWPVETAEQFCKNDQTVLADGQAVAVTEETVDSNGERCFWWNFKFPFQDALGKRYIGGVGIDITEKSRAEAALRTSEERYRTLAEATTDVIYILDQTGKLLYANGTAAAYFGVTPEALVGKNQQDLFSPEQVPFHLDHIRKVFETGEMQEAEVLYRFGPGDVWLNVRTIPLRDGQGRITSAMGVCRNITRQKRIELALRESEQRMRLHVQQTPLAVIECDVNGNVRQWNPGAERLFGYSEHEAIGRHFSFVVPPRVHTQMTQVWDTLLAKKGGERSTSENVTKDGRSIVCEWYSTSLVNAEGQVIGVASLAEDITERQQAEVALQKAHDELERRVEERTAELQASKERFELAVRGAGVGIWDWDIRTGKVYYSRRWKMLFGYEENEIGEGVDDWARLLHPDERDRIIKFQQDFLAGTSSNITAEYRLQHKDGSYRWIAAHGVVVRDEQGKAIRLVGSHGDITDRKQAEEKLKAEQHTLRRMVLASDHERRLITYELHDGVAQQILGAKMLFGSQQPPKGGKSKAADAYRDGMAALTQASSEIRRVMNWLRTPVLDRFGLVEAIEDIASQLRLRPDAPEIECRHAVKFKRLEPTLENTLFRIAQEAMTNACRHSKSEKLHVKLTQKGGDVALEVRDWGIGFDQDKVHENRFGLEGIRERARILGGKLRIKSKPGEGTVVRARFPVIEAVDEE